MTDIDISPLGIGPITMAPLADRVAAYLARVGDAIHTCNPNCSKPEHLVYEMQREIARLSSALTACEKQLQAAEAFAAAVQVVIYAQTNQTVDVIGVKKMNAQHAALVEFRKAMKGETK